jgi:hypothetical protein
VIVFVDVVFAQLERKLSEMEDIQDDEVVFEPEEIILSSSMIRESESTTSIVRERRQFGVPPSAKSSISSTAVISVTNSLSSAISQSAFESVSQTESAVKQEPSNSPEDVQSTDDQAAANGQAEKDQAQANLDAQQALTEANLEAARKQTQDNLQAVIDSSSNNVDVDSSSATSQVEVTATPLTLPSSAVQSIPFTSITPTNNLNGGLPTGDLTDFNQNTENSDTLKVVVPLVIVMFFCIIAVCVVFIMHRRQRRDPQLPSQRKDPYLLIDSNVNAEVPAANVSPRTARYRAAAPFEINVPRPYTERRISVPTSPTKSQEQYMHQRKQRSPTKYESRISEESNDNTPIGEYNLYQFDSNIQQPSPAFEYANSDRLSTSSFKITDHNSLLDGLPRLKSPNQYIRATQNLHNSNRMRRPSIDSVYSVMSQEQIISAFSFNRSFERMSGSSAGSNRSKSPDANNPFK